MQKTSVGTLTGTTDLALTAVTADTVHTGLHVTVTSQQADPLDVQVLLKRGATQYRPHWVEELEAKDSVSFALTHVLEAADQLVLKQSGRDDADEPVSFPISDAPASTAAQAGSSSGAHSVSLGTTLFA